MRYNSSTEEARALYGHLLPAYDWQEPEINADGIPCCPVCHEPLIGIWHDDALFHECPKLGDLFIADIGKPYLQACACKRELCTSARTEAWALEEKRRHLLEEAHLPKAVSYLNFSTLDFRRNENWKELSRLLGKFVCEWTQNTRSGALLVGPSGAGKTTMLAALAAEFIQFHRVPVRYFTERELVDGMRNRRAQTVSVINASTVVLVDDLGSTQYRNGNRNLATQGELWDAVTEIEGACATLIAASTYTPEGLVNECGIREETVLKLNRLCPRGYRAFPTEKNVKKSLPSMER